MKPLQPSRCNILQRLLLVHELPLGDMQPSVLGMRKQSRDQVPRRGKTLLDVE